METQNQKTNLAANMADLTCELAKTCNDKEVYFSSLFNLTPAEFKCLRLFTKTDSLSIKFIASTMGLTPGRITHILTSLEEKKFIRRNVDEKDKRNIIVSLTQKSQPFLRNLNQSHIKLHEDILAKIPEDRQVLVLDSLREVIKALRKWSEEIA
jgi:DNA-binding MarR family transcriptional regulator